MTKTTISPRAKRTPALTAYLDERTAAELKAAQDATDAAFAKLGVE